MSDLLEPNAHEAFAEKRAALRQKLLVARVLDATTPVEFAGTFSGGGDSGNYDGGGYQNEEVDDFFGEALTEFVTFDWYNNDGGGGDITWDVVKDKITINGYYNLVESISEMTEEEF